MVRLVLLRLLESYFRHWFLYPLPIFLLAALAAVSAFTAKPTYMALGAFYVQKESLLASLTSIQNSGFAWVTPAQATVDEFKELIQTDSFIRAIIQKTDLESSMTGSGVLGVIGAVGAALLDSTYRFPIDVKNGLDLPVLAVVPDTGRSKSASAKAGGKERKAKK